MAMHFGVITAATSWDQLLAALRTVAGDFIDVGAVPHIEDFDLKPTEGTLRRISDPAGPSATDNRCQAHAARWFDRVRHRPGVAL
jgi:hypothetical protein